MHRIETLNQSSAQTEAGRNLLSSRSHPMSPSLRKLLTVAVGAGILGGSAPAAALAGGGTTKPPKCDPTVQVCDDGRKNG